MESLGAGDGPKGMIRHRETDKYYKGAGEWTFEVGEAMQFDGLTAVEKEAQKYHLQGSCEFIVELHGQIRFRVLLSL